MFTKSSIFSGAYCVPLAAASGVQLVLIFISSELSLSSVVLYRYQVFFRLFPFHSSLDPEMS